MAPIHQITGVAAPLLRADVSTDVIIPSRLIDSPLREGYGAKLFAPWRFLPDGREDPSFILNRPGYRDSRILVAGENFGCGSSREMAVWALHQFGIRCVVAPSFSTIFRDNCLRNRLLPVVLSRPVVDALARSAQASTAAWTVDLDDCCITTPQGGRYPFAIDASERERFVLGLDAIAATLLHVEPIDRFVAADRVNRPWVWR